ncbi:MAG TPA: hypothetical protein VFA89_00680 [Terriglobales bacterium]|nr:hypothetical protein [Terriglobales bacterium]
MKKLLLLCLALFVLLTVIAYAADSETVNGYVADSICGVKGAAPNQEACTKKCLEKGAKMVVVTDSDKKVLTVDNPDALKGHEGHHVAVTGHVSGDSIHVESAKML